MYLNQESFNFPKPQDLLKFVYQAAFGVEHLITDHANTRAMFFEEYEKTSPRDICGGFSTYLTDDVCRVDIGVWKAWGLDKEWLVKLFLASAARSGSRKKFRQLVDFASGAVYQGEQTKSPCFEFGLREWTQYLRKYVLENPTKPPVRHSEEYRERYTPAYRLVCGTATALLPIFAKLHSRDHGVIALDGRAAAGKTTLAIVLAGVLGAGVIHMDDFFLPPALRTDERLKTPGQNFHHERFCEQVLPYLTPNAAGEFRSISYRAFDCNVMDYGEMRTIPAGRWRIVEGAYSLHPMLGDYADVRVFADVSKKKQMRRIVKRNGVEVAKVYRDRWIPMEEEYILETRNQRLKTRKSCTSHAMSVRHSHVVVTI